VSFKTICLALRIGISHKLRFIIGLYVKNLVSVNFLSWYLLLYEIHKQLPIFLQKYMQTLTGLLSCFPFVSTYIHIHVNGLHFLNAYNLFMGFFILLIIIMYCIITSNIHDVHRVIWLNFAIFWIDVTITYVLTSVYVINSLCIITWLFVTSLQQQFRDQLFLSVSLFLCGIDIQSSLSVHSFLSKSLLKLK
jgi:hypothetical protein